MEERQHKAEVDQILYQAWDTLGGQPYTDTIVRFTSDRSELEKVRRLLVLATTLAPKDPMVHMRWGSYHWAKGDHEEALAEFDKALRLDPQYALAYYNRGTALRTLRRYEEALAAFDEALRLDPQNAIVHNNRGTVLRTLRRYEEALAAFNEALRLDPQDAIVHNNRGSVLGQMGRPTEALAAFDEALRLDPQHALAHPNRGRVLSELGRHE